MVAALYDYLPTSYTNPYRAKYNTHKKSELRNVYNAIVKLNKRSPLYMFRPTFENQVYVLRLKDSAIALNSVISEYSDENSSSSIFQSKKVASSDPYIAVAEIQTANYDNLPEEFTLKVNSLAKKQINTGTDCMSDNHGLIAGTYKFTIDMEEEIYNFQLDIFDKSTNYENQLKLADYINDYDIGITLSALKDSSNGTSKVIIEANDTGSTRNLAFSFYDTSSPSESRGIVNYFGLNHVSDYPANSNFEINGITKESLSNSFTYNRSILVHLKSESNTPVTIGYTSDKELILDGVETFVDSYNHFISIAKDTSFTQKKTTLLLDYLSDITHDFENELEACGLNIVDDCAFEIDQSLVLSAAIDGDIKNLMTDKNGFVSKLRDKLSQITIDPMEYLNKTIVTYPNTTKPAFANPYITSMYSGMLYNLYC